MANKIIKSVNLLPEFLRTDKNSKFLSSTIDQLIQPPQLERIDGYIGSKLTPTYNPTTDFYLAESGTLRRDYQLDPALIVKSAECAVNDVIAIDDLVNELTTQGGNAANFDRSFRSKFYSYDPHIDWDKLVNYQDYYWLPAGPAPVVITGPQQASDSTYTVQDDANGNTFIFTPDGATADPLITLYRGNTYHFDVTSAHKFYIKTAPTLQSVDQYSTGVTNNGISSGKITIVIDQSTPDTLFYISGDSELAEGQFVIKTIDWDTVLDIDATISGKESYTTDSGITLSNGMKIKFGEHVTPESYQNKEFFVEGVGNAIKLVDYALLTSAKELANIYIDQFDSTPFDDYPYDNFKSLPINPEYITINRASTDLNPWSKYNRWVHGNVIKAVAVANGQLPVYPADKKATRPIIEFRADLKLYNFGSVGIKNVDLIDTYTVDAFSTVEGSAGYYVDGVLLEQGHRVIFNADTDIMVRGKIYQVNYIVVNNKLQLILEEPTDHVPPNMAAVSVNLGTAFAGTAWWYNADAWQFAQQHGSLNQPPLFELFDNLGHSYADTTYHLTNFAGNKIFGYDVGTGTADTVLGFPLKYKNSAGVGSYLFKNYFMSDTIAISNGTQVVDTISTGITYCKFSKAPAPQYSNVWQLADSYRIPILQFQAITTETLSVELTAVDTPITSVTSVAVYQNTIKLNATDFNITTTRGKYLINFATVLPVGTTILLKIYANQTPNSNGYYEPPLGLSNNPLNGSISSLTLSELGDHLTTMVESAPSTATELRDAPHIAAYGNRLMANANPMAFAHFFLGKKEHSAIDAIVAAGDQYNQFKMALLKNITAIVDQTDPVIAVDTVLKDLNSDKDLLSPYYLSDMVAYGTDKTTRLWTVTDPRNTAYPLSVDYDPQVLSTHSVLVYLNGRQLLLATDYEFDVADASLQLLVTLAVGDQLSVDYYSDTRGSFVPPTPTKLGLYPKYLPSIYVDNTYIVPTTVIQGHDGSIMIAYNDFRDDIILEFEKRIYNNIKSQYRAELFDINAINAGAFRESEYSQEEITNILQRDFMKWAGFYGIDYATNHTFDLNDPNQENPFAWNYLGGYNVTLDAPISGSWRAAYKYLYDTDRPHTHPWEMLGFTEQPAWWESEYGPAPYTSGNDILWNDIEQGMIRGQIDHGINLTYARPNLKSMLPVDEAGQLVTPIASDTNSPLISNWTVFNRRQNWKFGDQGPAETAWRRSSYWPFAVQRLLALTKPADYSALMYDPSRLNKNIAGQWTYGSDHKFLNPTTVAVCSNATLTNGYSVYVTEIGQQRTSEYTQSLTQDLAYINFNLFHKVGGFVSKDKLQIVIDSYEPTSTSPGALLPQEDYNLILNVSNPVKSVSISGLLIQKIDGKFIVKGYDKLNPYFTVHSPIRNTNTASMTIGGISEPYVNWASATTGNEVTLSAADTTTAYSAITGKFYQQGQLVAHGNKFYRVTVSHQGGQAFNTAYYQILSALPMIGGATVQTAVKFDTTPVQISYGTEFSTIQSVYDVIVGYGDWLESQGFVFGEYNSTMDDIIDWNFTSKEFLYWTTQNWSNNSIIALSPFADQIKYKFANSVIDNIFDSFYEYSLLLSNGLPFPRKSLSVDRQDGLCTVRTLTTTDGIYFATLRSVQKEHAMVFNNITQFNDVIYDIETGYRQRRMKLLGFRTANWDGDYFSPGFVYDTAQISNWTAYKNYQASDIVRFNSAYYSANNRIDGSAKFDFTKWALLGEKPVAGLLPNFDYKINQFEDFYSLDIDNFDSAQQKMAQHLIGYTPRVYLNNIFTNPIAQYKFYQGFIKEKGTKNAVTKLAKASIHNLQGEIEFTEEWAFRVGNYGSYETYQELEIPLVEGTFAENPQIIKFVNDSPTIHPDDLFYYNAASNNAITPTDYISSATFVTSPGTYLDNDFKLATAGYVRLDDVTATAYNENSLLDIANNRSLMDGDVIWQGFKQNGDWDVLRYARSTARITGVFVSAPASEITFVADYLHNLEVGDIVSISQFNEQVNGVHIVTSIPSLTQFAVASSLVAIVNAELLSPGLLFKFKSARFNTFDALPSDQELLTLPVDTKVWIDDNGSGKWTVYQKTKTYDYSTISSYDTPPNQHLGWAMSKRSNSDILAISAPNFHKDADYGKVVVYTTMYDAATATSSVQYKFKYILNQAKKYYTPGTPTEFGYAVVYDDHEFNNTGYGLLIAGAPATSNVKATGAAGSVRYSLGNGTASMLTQEGIVKLSSIDPTLVEESAHAFVLASPHPSSYERFGSSLFVERNTDTKLMLVGAPQTATIGTGHVYSYLVTTTSTSNAYYTTTASCVINVIPHSAGIEVLSTTSITLTTGSQWGYCISGSDNARVIAISAPGYSANTGVVQLFSGTTYLQTIHSPHGLGGRFGETVSVSPTGDYLFVAAPLARNVDQSYGVVTVYKKQQATADFVLIATIVNPVPHAGMKFGAAISINELNDTLVISAVGVNKTLHTTFDKSKGAATTFDSDSTDFFGSIQDSGTVYVYNRKFDRFVLSEELNPSAPIAGTNFGHSIAVDSHSIIVGAPTCNNPAVASTVYQFNVVESAQNGWIALREQSDLVNIDVVQNVRLIDVFNEDIIDYLDIVDPVKGRIVGVADQELKYKSASDPAIYSLGTAGTVNDTNTNWLDDHVGELWWDLSTAKYMWYEQGDASYRKNQWGNLFPGATIDVYEWVGSEYLPSEWSITADTTIGLATGISGQPKFADNSVISIKQIYSAVSNSFSNYYYYWVKNKVTVPAAKNRRSSSYQVASMIESPTAYGLRYAALIAADAIALANVSELVVGNRVHLNIASDIINSDINKHTEWLLLQEGAAQSRPNALLEKKLIDSLLGHDSLGNAVPDPALTARTRYGIGIRPRQTLFKNRYEAMRNLVDFANSVLLVNRISGNYSFANLSKQEQIPDASSREYDQVVEDNESLNSAVIDTRQLKQAELSCTVDNGKIRSVGIIDAGFGYKIAPTVKVIGTQGSGAELLTEIDSAGRIISVSINNSGSNYAVAPILTVRPYTVIVLADTQYNGKWTKFIFDQSISQWVRLHTQQYNTPLYWKYVDWTSATYNKFVDYAFTISDIYELATLTASTGQYVKVKNGYLGNYIILEKTASSVTGSFDDQYNIVYSEQGTIQILDSVWNTNNTDYGFDQNNSYDQTMYDQTPDLEIQYILTALKDNIFVNELKVNWNLFFFKAVKYALSEQKLLDWAFKTSFINVTNVAGYLDQRPVYKLQNSEYYEQYLNEVKPYHTIIRSFTTAHAVIEPSASYTTDFDLPAIYDKTQDKFTAITPLGVHLIDATTNQLDTYPWKSWADNYSYKVGSISVGRSGSGYTAAPVVEIQAAAGDAGTGATAEAYIRSGEVVSIKITNAGKDYTRTPLIILTGGGNPSALATCYAQLVNEKVRSIAIGMKFDRISRANQIGTMPVTDSFICNGSNTEFVLNWLAEPIKSTIDITLDGMLVMSADYTVVYYDAQYGDYTKKYSKLVLLNIVPTAGQVLVISYVKNTRLLTATERVLNYYAPTAGMPGAELGQLMTGIDYPVTQIHGLPFDYATAWDIEYSPFGKSSWADTVTQQVSAVIVTTATTGTNVLTLNTTSNLVVGQLTNITGYTANKFSTSTDVMITAIDPVTCQITVSAALADTVASNTPIEFWSNDSAINAIDTVVDGGSMDLWTYSVAGAAGIPPGEIIIDSDIFLSTKLSQSPEELVSGQVADSVGISVYTKNPIGSPVILSNNIDIIARTTTTTALSIVPPSSDSITVVVDNRIFVYNSTTNFTSDSQFSIIWKTNELVIPPQATAGKLAYTILSIGGGRADTEAGIIDHASITVTDISSAQLVSLAALGTIKSAYVTVNGKSISAVSTSTDYGYELTIADIDNRRAAINVHNLPTGTNTIQAWFFANNFKYFNEVKEQSFELAAATIFELMQPPGTIEPAAAQAIVEINNTTGRKRLLPPNVSYYEITNPSNTVFLIDNHRAVGARANIFDISTVRVYVNGVSLRAGFDFTVNSATASAVIDSVKLSLNDVVAIVGLVPGEYDYDIVGSTLTIADPQLTGTIKVITYTNQDGMLMQTERFTGEPTTKQYKLSHPVFDINYVWVQVNGIPLTSGVDYQLVDAIHRADRPAAGQIIVQLSDPRLSTDEIVITSFNSRKLASTVLGYRVFNDMFNRTHFSRLSKNDTTHLTQPLTFTDTEIHVADASALTPPLPAKKLPGVIIIDGERITFFKVRNNVLSQLRRGTLGTSPRIYLDVNTKVIDQGSTQTISFAETVYKQTHKTESTNTYIINTATTTEFGDGITLITAVTLPSVDQTRLNNKLINTKYATTTFDDEFAVFDDNTCVFDQVPIQAVDQVSVYYGGRLLRKSSMIVHDTAAAFDSPVANIIGRLQTTTKLSTVPTPAVGDAYLITYTNQIWIYTDSHESDAIHGYVYRGLNYLPAEFSINVFTQKLRLNIAAGITPDINLVVTKKEVSTGLDWNGTSTDGTSVSLMDSGSDIAKFLQTCPAELPDNYYYSTH